MKRMVAATGNAHKLAELTRILGPLGIQVVSQQEAGVELSPEETGSTFAANARIKALAIHQACGAATIADDSGLCVDALDGAPGVYSARYGGPGLDDVGRTDKLLEAMRGVPKENRGAQFVSAICCALEDGALLECEGRCRGWIGYAPVGGGGFGYDPVFMVDGQSFSQLSPAEKDAISHRGRALEEFCRLLADIR